MRLRLYTAMLVLLFLLSACGVQGNLNGPNHGKDTGIPALNEAIHNYFVNFDSIHQWSAYATDDYVKRVYS